MRLKINISFNRTRKIKSINTSNLEKIIADAIGKSVGEEYEEQEVFSFF